MIKIQNLLLLTFFLHFTDAQNCHRDQPDLSDKSKSTYEQLCDLQTKFVSLHKEYPMQQSYLLRNSAGSTCSMGIVSYHLGTINPFICAFTIITAYFSADTACNIYYREHTIPKIDKELLKMQLYMTQNFTQEDIEQYLIKSSGKWVGWETCYNNSMYYDKKRGTQFYDDLLRDIINTKKAPAAPQMK